MGYTPPERHDALKVTPDKIKLTFTSEPFVVYTFRGYAPVVNVKTGAGEQRTLYISSKSVSDQLHNVVLKNNDEWKDLTVRIWKESADRFAKYLVEELDGPDDEGAGDGDADEKEEKDESGAGTSDMPPEDAVPEAAADDEKED